MSLVLIDPEVCPDCGGRLLDVQADQQPLIRHAGYGAALRNIVRYCSRCCYHLHAETSETRP